jgi:hypothetical protein
MPTRSGPFMLVLITKPFSGSEQPGVLRFMAHAGEIGAECRAAEIVLSDCAHVRAIFRCRRAAASTDSSAASTRWLSVCPSGMSRTPAEIQFEVVACRKRAASTQAERDALRRDPDRDRIRSPGPVDVRRSRSSASQGQAERAISTKARPCAVVSRCRSREGTNAVGQFGNIVQGLPSPPRQRDRHGTAMCHRKSPAPFNSIASASPAAWPCVGDVTGLDGPFDSAGIGKCTDRKRGRQPCHQPEQRG